MSPIKILLAVPLVAVVLLFLVKLRSQSFYRFTFLAMGMVGIVFVLDPELTTVLANRLGVGRGTDLLLYLCVIAGFCGMLVFFSKLRKLEVVQTQFIREHAIELARKPSV